MPSMPYFHMYPADWISDSNVIEMTMQQEGIYHRLLCMAWLSDSCTIPADKKHISQNLLKGFVGRDLDAVLRLWKPHPEQRGRLYNPRLWKEWKLARTRAVAGTRGAESRWRGHGKPDGKPDGKTMPSQNSESMTHELRTHDSHSAPGSPATADVSKLKFGLDSVEQMTIAWNEEMPMGVARARPPSKAPESAKRMLKRITASPWIYEEWRAILHGAHATYEKMIEKDEASFLTFPWIATKASLSKIEEFRNFKTTATKRKPADECSTRVMDRKGGEK